MKRTYLLLIAVIVAALGITFYSSLSYHYEMQGEAIDLSEYDIEPYGYDMVIKNQNRSFVVNGDDPQFILSSTQGTLGTMLGGIELTFDSEWI